MGDFRQTKDERARSAQEQRMKGKRSGQEVLDEAVRLGAVLARIENSKTSVPLAGTRGALGRFIELAIWPAHGLEKGGRYCAWICSKQGCCS